MRAKRTRTSRSMLAHMVNPKVRQGFGSRRGSSVGGSGAYKRGICALGSLFQGHLLAGSGIRIAKERRDLSLVLAWMSSPSAARN
jgi:hypothetical protein